MVDLSISLVISSIVADSCGHGDSISTVVVGGAMMAVGIFGISL